MKSIKSCWVVTLVGILFFCLTARAFALDPASHEELNEKIARGYYPGCFPLDNYLKLNLGFENGITESLNYKTVYEWVRYGGSREDIEILPYLRSFNHFHDPLVENWFWAGYGHTGTFKSSAVWAMTPYQEPILGGYSWPDARRYFYDALTAKYKTTRDSNYALCFRALGQVMHLMEDASVPAHTRNDGHVIYNYEKWVVNNAAVVDNIAKTTLSPVTPHITSAPVSDLFDMDLYNGSNPSITLSLDAGLTEYVNANFFSEGTIFNGYPFPSTKSVVPVDNYIKDPKDPTKQVLRKYYFKTGDGDSGYILAAIGYLGDYQRQYLPWLGDSWIYDSSQSIIDDNCYEEYAKRLIPRAIAYAAEIPRYFFRGQIDAVEAKTTTNDDGEISGMTMKVKNSTPGELMVGGKLVVAYSYDMPNSAERVYNVTQEQSLPWLSAEATTDNEYEFSFPDPIPSDAKNVQYMLVYKGSLGAEQGAVAAKSFEAELDWTYLYIIQKDFKIGHTDSIYKESSNSLADTFREETYANFYYENGTGFYEWDFDFDLEWSGRMDEIENIDVTLTRNNTILYSFDLDSQDPMHSIEVIYPTKEKPTGNLRIYIKQNMMNQVYNIWIRIETKNNEGDTVVYPELALFSYNHFIKETKKANSAGYQGTTYISYASLILIPVDGSGAANYYISDFPTYDNYIRPELCEYRWFSSGIFDLKYVLDYLTREKYAQVCIPQGVLAPFLDLPYSISTQEVIREWDDSVTDDLGIDKSKLKSWSIPVKYWKIEE